jgi:hypothetical protein
MNVNIKLFGYGRSVVRNSDYGLEILFFIAALLLE